MREVMFEEFINLKKCDMKVEGYSMMFTLLFMYAPSLVSNTMDEMSRFPTGVANLVKEECRTTMLHNDMNLSRIILYELSIKECNFSRILRNLNRGRTIEKNQPRFKKRNKNQEGLVLLRSSLRVVVVPKLLCLHGGKSTLGSV